MVSLAPVHLAHTLLFLAQFLQELLTSGQFGSAALFGRFLEMAALFHLGIETGTFALAFELFQDLVDRSVVIVDVYDWHVTDHPLFVLYFGRTLPAKQTILHTSHAFGKSFFDNH